MPPVISVTTSERFPEWNSKGTMRAFRLLLFLALFVSVAVQVSAAPFTLFPKAGRLASPDGRFEVRDIDQREPGSEFFGIFHSLWLIETATGHSRKLCDYVGIAAVAWSEKDFLVVTQYLSKKTSRALVFSTASAQEQVPARHSHSDPDGPCGASSDAARKRSCIRGSLAAGGRDLLFSSVGIWPARPQRFSLELRIRPWRGSFKVRSEK